MCKLLWQRHFHGSRPEWGWGGSVGHVCVPLTDEEPPASSLSPSLRSARLHTLPFNTPVLQAEVDAFVPVSVSISHRPWCALSLNLALPLYRPSEDCAFTVNPVYPAMAYPISHNREFCLFVLLPRTSFNTIKSKRNGH